MKVFFHPEAEEEFNAAIDYYEAMQPNQGLNFALEVHSAIDRIIAHPTAWSVINPVDPQQTGLECNAGLTLTLTLPVDKGIRI